MAIKYGTNATNISNSTIPALGENHEQNGRVGCIYDEYAFTADLAANDIIYMGGLIPAGSRVIEVTVDSPDLDTQSAGALTCGWAASADAVVAASAAGFLSSLDVHTAGKTLSMSTLLQSVCAGKYKKFASAVQPTITISGETDATSGTIRMILLYI